MASDIMTGNPRVDTMLEQLCEDGCREVRAYIDALTCGGTLDGRVEHLSEEERLLLRDELQAIMKIYGDKCRL